LQLRQMPQPLCASPATRVPTAYLAATFSDALRSSATATTSPAHSWPMTAGKVGGQKPGNLPAMILGSVPQMATALTRQRTSSPFGSGVGTSWISKSFGPLRTSAFMVFGMSVIVSPLSVEPGKRCLVDGRGEAPRLFGRCSVVRQRQDLRGEPALVVDIVERPMLFPGRVREAALVSRELGFEGIEISMRSPAELRRRELEDLLRNAGPVSYTHLTLPTNR